MNAGKILVTGSTGGLGKAIVAALLKRIPAQRIVATARDTSKAAELAARGVEVRHADYLDYQSLVSSFQGIDKVFLVSAVAFTDRTPQHAHAIQAARAAGVKEIFYTAIERNGIDDVAIASVTQSDIETELLLRESGLAYTILKHPLYVESLPVFLGGKVRETGVRTPAGLGRIPLTSRDDLAEGAAALLVETSAGPREISLNSGKAYSFADVAEALSAIHGSAVSVTPVSAEIYIAERVAEGLPPPVAEFFSQWLVAIEQGAFDAPSPMLAQLIGRDPLTVHEGLTAALASQRA